MSTVSKGNAYEDFVESIFKAICYAEQEDGNHKSINLEKKKKIISRDGIEREIDIYWEYEILGQKFKAAIECKDYDSKISIDKIDAFVAKMKTLPIDKGIFATKRGFQSGAITTAKAENISLILVRDIEDKDIEDRITAIVVHITATNPPLIDSSQIEFTFDESWMKTNTKYSKGDSVRISGTELEIKIHDILKSEMYSLTDLINGEFRNSSVGKHIWERHFDNGFLITPNANYKITYAKIPYQVCEPITNTMSIDARRCLLGVVEYISEEREKLIVSKPPPPYIRDALRKCSKDTIRKTDGLK